MKNILKTLAFSTVCLGFLVACTWKDAVTIAPEPTPLGVLLQPYAPQPIASGVSVQKNEKGEVDYSNARDGYIMAKYTGNTRKELRVMIKCPGGKTYTYELNGAGLYEAFPLTEGGGSYQTTVLENINGAKYATVVSVTFPVALSDEFTPFLRPSQYVNYTGGSAAVRKAAELSANASGLIEIISNVYGYVTRNISYDKQLAATVKSGYLSDVDAILQKGRGICFDYAAVMASMLRSQKIPTKLVVGYTGKAYHAWLNVYSEETGWVDGVVFFDGGSWSLMDPTFAASNTAAASSSYAAKFQY